MIWALVLPLILVNSASKHQNLTTTGPTKELVPIDDWIFRPYGKKILAHGTLWSISSINTRTHWSLPHLPSRDNLHESTLFFCLQLLQFFPLKQYYRRNNFGIGNYVHIYRLGQTWLIDWHLRCIGTTLTNRSNNQTSHSWQWLSRLRIRAIATDRTKCIRRNRSSGTAKQTQTTNCTRPIQ